MFARTLAPKPVSANSTHAALFLACVFTSTAFSQVVINPANGHGYQAVPGQMTWEQARSAAALRTHNGVQGHLATITSASETNFLLNTFGVRDSFAIGGIQVGGPEPAGGWTWITGEPWNYTDWDTIEPNNAFIHGQFENRLTWKTGTVGRWNDVAADVNEGPNPGQYRMNGYFVEFDLPPCDSIDFNNDTSFFDPQDIDAFLSVYSEGPCIPANAICNDIDFNNDTSVFDPCDIDSFLLMYSEGPCTPCGQ